MDILYCLGEGSKWNNNELRYSLRSLEKFGKNVGNIYVVGYNPGILSDKVTFIDCPNKYDRKQKNILQAVVYAVEHSNIEEEFLYSSDDHFYIRETDFNNYPYFYKGELIAKVSNENRFKKYFLSLVETRILLKKYNLPYYNFSQHGNTHFTREGIKRAKQIIEESYHTRYGCEPTCIVLNTIYSYSPFEIIKRDDLKIKNLKDKEDLIIKIGNREVFSISDMAIEKGVKEYLEQLFPEKSIYEK